MRVDEQGKAVVGAVLAGLVAGSGAMVTGLAATGGEVTAPVVWGALAALFAAIATTWTGVYFTSNAGTPPPQVPLYVGREDAEEWPEDNMATGDVAVTDAWRFS